MSSNDKLSPQIMEELTVRNQNAPAKPKEHQKRHDWMVMYEALVRFGGEHGHCNVPLRFPRVKVNETDSAHLGAWLATQRREHLNGKMKPERLVLMQKLVDSNMLEWSPLNHSKQSEQTWPLMYECLKMYCRERQLEQPGCEVSSIPETRKWRHPDGWEVGLGRWMHTQNKQRRAGKLRADRCAKMEELVKAGMFRWPSQRVLKANSGSKTSCATASGETVRGDGSRAPTSMASGTNNNVAGNKSGKIAVDGVIDEVTEAPVPDRGGGAYRLRKAPQRSSTGQVSNEGSSSFKSVKRGRLNNSTYVTTSTFDTSSSFSNFGGFGGRVGSGNFLGPLYSLAIPAAGMQYARQLSAEYIMKASESRNDGLCDVIFPIPSLRKSIGKSSTSDSLSAQLQGMTARDFEINPDEPLPLPFTMKSSERELTKDLKQQIQAQILACLVIDATENNPENLDEILEQLATAAVDTLDYL